MQGFQTTVPGPRDNVDCCHAQIDTGLGTMLKCQGWINQVPYQDVQRRSE
jgi:hypothetical protein